VTIEEHRNRSRSRFDDGLEVGTPVRLHKCLEYINLARGASQSLDTRRVAAIFCGDLVTRSATTDVSIVEGRTWWTQDSSPWWTSRPVGREESR
jgi:hypothetical protein